MNLFAFRLPLPVSSGKNLVAVAVLSLAVATFAGPPLAAASGISVSVSPASVTLPAGANLTFDASVAGTSNSAVSWSVSEGANGGTISSTGAYTATQTVGTYHVVATSQADSSASGTAVVRVQTITSGAGFRPPTWSPLGPTQIPNAHGCDNSNESNLAAAGKVQAFAVDLADSQVMYAAGGIGPGNSGPNSDGGIYESTDGGLDWTQQDNGLTDTHVDALWLDQASPQTLVATTFYNGIFYSDNGGASWRNVYPSSATAIVQYGSALYVGTGDGVVESTNSGASWQLVEPTSSPVRALGGAQGVLYAGLDDGTILGRSGPGASWQLLLQPGPAFTARDIAVNPANPKEAIVVLVGSSGSENEITQDGGSSWSKWTAPPAGGLCNSGGPAQVIAFDAVNSKVIYAGSGGALYVSTDGGSTWTVTHLVEDLGLIYPYPGKTGVFVAGGDQGIYLSQDRGQSYSSLNGDLTTSLLDGLAVNGSEIFAPAQGFSPVESTDGGSTWLQLSGTNPPTGEDGDALINPGDSNYQYFFSSIGFQYSTDGGQNFTTSSQVPGSEWTSNGAEDLIAVDTQNPSTVYVVGKDGIYKSTDWGVDWTLQSGWPMSYPDLVAVDPSNSNTIFVGTMPPLPNCGGALFVTHDGGNTWTQSSLPPNPNCIASYPVSIAVDPANSNMVAVGMSSTPNNPDGGVLLSSDGGNSFTEDNVGVASYDLAASQRYRYFTWAVRFAPRTYPNVLVATTVHGMYIQNPGGVWTAINANAVPEWFTDAGWTGSGLSTTKFYTTTYGEGVLETPMTDALSSLAITPMPAVFANQTVKTTSSPLSLTVVNKNGPNTVTLGAISLNGGNAGDFSISNSSTCTNGLSLSVNGNCVINVTFAATVQGPAAATLNVAYTNGYGSSSNILIQGDGVIPPPPGISGLADVTITAPGQGSEPFTISGTGALTVTATSSNSQLLPDSSITGQASCTAAGSCTLTLRPAAGQSGTATVTVKVSDTYGQSTTGTFTLTVKKPAAPTVSGLSDLSLKEGQAGPESFTISGTGALTVTATSSNPTLLPDSNITGEPSCTAAGSCTLTLQSAAGQSGTATVTVKVSDTYGQSDTGTFTLTIASGPTVSGLSDLSLREGQSGSESFTVSGKNPLTVTATSSNPALLPDAGITGEASCTASGGCTLALQPAAGQSAPTAIAVVTVKVSDASGQDNTGSFTLTVTKPAPPAVNGLSNLSLKPGQSGMESFTVSGTGSLTVTAVSSDPTLLPNADITGESSCTASGGCTLSLQPAAGQSGTATVTVTVDDSYGQSASGVFSVNETTTSSSGNGSNAASGGGGGLGVPMLGALLSLLLLIRIRARCRRH